MSTPTAGKKYTVRLFPHSETESLRFVQAVGRFGNLQFQNTEVRGVRGLVTIPTQMWNDAIQAGRVTAL